MPQKKIKKTLKVIPDKRQFVLPDEAEIHNDYEYNKEKRYESDDFIAGNFSITKLSPKQGCRISPSGGMWD